MDIKFTTFVEAVSVWSIVTVFEPPVSVAVILWSAEPVCVVVMSLLFPLIVQLLIQPTTSQVPVNSLEVPVIEKSWLPPVAVEAAPCVQVNILLSPVAA